MGLREILLLAGLLILLRLIPSRQIQRGFLLVCSCVFPFLFQPVLPVRGLDFFFPLLTLLLTLCVYTAFSGFEFPKNRRNAADLGLILGTVLLITATRFISYDGIVTASRPPMMRKVLPELVSTS